MRLQVPALRHPARWGLAAVLAIVVLSVAGSLVLAGDGVPRGVSVVGLDLGGLSREDAEARLTQHLRKAGDSPLSLVADDEALTVEPAALSVDVPTTVDQALSVGLLDRVTALLGVEREVPPAVDVDEPALSRELARVAEGFDRKAREGAITFNDKAAPAAVPPITGRVLDVAGAVEAVREGWLREARIEVPVDVTDVRASEQDVQRALEEVARPAVSAPVTVDVEGDELVLAPVEIAAALTFEVEESGALAPRLDPAAFYEQVRYRLRTVGQPPVDATFDVSSGTPVVVPSKGGRTVSSTDLAAAVLEVLTDEAPREVSAPLSDVAARISTEQARKLGVREVLGTFTTRHPCCRPRVENIHRIADIVDDHVLLPGDDFDLNAFVGPRDAARGFVAAPQILEGEFVDSIGGGISQFVTTMFNTVFFSGLEDVTHVPHSYYISRYPPGREATVSFPLPDFVFRNDSPHGVYIDTAFTGTSITVTFWGTERFEDVRSVTGPRTRMRNFETKYDERETCSDTKGGQGFDIVVTRVFVAGGRDVEREDFKTRYLPEPRVVCGPPPRAAPRSTPTETPSPSPASPPPPAPPT